MRQWFQCEINNGSTRTRCVQTRLNRRWRAFNPFVDNDFRKRAKLLPARESFRGAAARTIFEACNDPPGQQAHVDHEQTTSPKAPDPAADMPALVHENLSGGEQRVSFADEVHIGREEGDIRIATDPYLSQRHARIERSVNGFQIHDCRSTNGTFVQVRQPIELRPGDEILIGSQLFRVDL